MTCKHCTLLLLHPEAAEDCCAIFYSCVAEWSWSACLKGLKTRCTINPCLQDQRADTLFNSQLSPTHNREWLTTLSQHVCLWPSLSSHDNKSIAGSQKQNLDEQSSRSNARTRIKSLQKRDFPPTINTSQFPTAPKACRICLVCSYLTRAKRKWQWDHTQSKRRNAASVDRTQCLQNTLTGVRRTEVDFSLALSQMS